MDQIRLKQIDDSSSNTTTLRNFTKTNVCFFCTKSYSSKLLYTCPRCNLAYCSLECYRSQDHLECSEAFYADQCRQNLESKVCASDECGKISEILRRHHRIQTETLSLTNDFQETDQRFEDLVRTGAIGQCIEHMTPWWAKSDFEEDQPPPFKLKPLRELISREIKDDVIQNGILCSLIGYIVVVRRYESDFMSREAARDWLEFNPPTATLANLTDFDLFSNLSVLAQHKLGIDRSTFWQGLIVVDLIGGMLKSRLAITKALFDCWRMVGLFGVDGGSEKVFNSFSRRNSTKIVDQTDAVGELKSIKRKIEFFVAYTNENTEISDVLSDRVSVILADN